ncbi:DUF805 domain-containing protein [Patescibacteria group bacterium]|nr:DUF805 domain-containing protein [Patescibacteria group bacterium]
MFRLKGRTSRANYFLVSLVFFILGIFLFTAQLLYRNPSLTIIVNLAVIIFSILFILPLSIRRIHDIGHSGWYYLLNFIPLVNFIFGLYILLCPGEKNANKYGSQPSGKIQIFKELFGGSDQAVPVDQSTPATQETPTGTTSQPFIQNPPTSQVPTPTTPTAETQNSN